jgi:two-component system sensor histidine kinase KdpD
MVDADRDRLERHLRLAESLGASVTRLAGASISAAVLGSARKQNVTRILVGKPTHSWLRDRVRGSLLDEIVRGSGDIDIHVIGGSPDEERHTRAAPGDRRPFRTAHYAWAAAIVALTTALAGAIRLLYPVPDLSVLYMLAVMIAAARFGRGPSTLAAALSVAAYDFFFVPPYLTFAVADARYFLTFAMMFGVGFIVGALTSRLRRQEHEAVQREERTSVLYALSRELGAADRPERIAEVVARHAADVFGATAAVLGGDEAGGLRLLATFPPGGLLAPSEEGVTRWSFEHGRIAGLGTDTLPGSSIVCAPLWVAGAPVGVVALQPRDHAPLRVEQREFLESFCRQAAIALDRVRLAEEARRAALRAESEQLRSSLLSTVSHDLRTPLASITGAATSLRDDLKLDETTRRELLQSICEETDRLERLVGNLLDMTRLEAGGLVLRREWVPVVEVIGSALTRLEGLLGDRPVLTDLPADLPLISVDPVVFEQLFVNLFENAAKYTPASSPIDVHARTEDGSVVMEVLDRGPGLPPGTLDRVFEKFYRGAHAGISGAGLGLAICRGIAEAHGGTISADNRPGGGARFRVAIPVVGSPPVAPAEGPP